MVGSRWMWVLAAATALVASAQARAQLKAVPGDWPGWRGPNRTGLSPETGLLKEWPADGPKQLWKATGLGDGFSTPSVAGGRIYLLGARGRTERVLALDAKDGQELWATPIGSMAGGHPGPRSTPTVDGDLLYALSSDGKLACLETGKGKVRWRKDLKADFDGRTGNWAYAESPLVDGDVVVCTPGGTTATLVALNKKTGEVVWKCAVTGLRGRGRGSYSSITLSNTSGRS